VTVIFPRTALLQGISCLIHSQVLPEFIKTSHHHGKQGSHTHIHTPRLSLLNCLQCDYTNDSSHITSQTSSKILRTQFSIITRYIRILYQTPKCDNRNDMLFIAPDEVSEFILRTERPDLVHNNRMEGTSRNS
jgi:hypothetical protein